MLSFTKWLSVTFAAVLMISPVAAVDTITSGKIRSINADNKTFVYTDSANNDHNFKLNDDTMINRGGKESKSDLKVGDAINVCYDKDSNAGTAKYVLVQEGTTKNCELHCGLVKSYNAEKKELTFTNDVQKDTVLTLAKPTVRLNNEETKIDAITIGDHVLMVVDGSDGKLATQCVMIHRKK